MHERGEWVLRNARSAAGPLFVFALALAAYVPMLPSTVSFEDSAEFVAAAATFGIPHPSGYPLFVLLGRAFAALPFGTIPWRVALLSAVSAAGAAAFAFAAARRLVRRRFPVSLGIEAVLAITVLTLAVSETWWSQAIMAEVYALHGLLAAATGYALVAWLDGAGERWRLAASLLFGLALSNHLFLTLPAAPVFLALIAYGLPREKRWRGVATSTAAAVIGLLPYAVLPLRSATGAFAMGDASTLRGFLDHVLRLRYGDVGTPAWNKVGLVLSYWGTVLGDLGPLLAVLGFAGAVALARSRTKTDRAALAWLAALLFVVPAVIAVRGLSWRPVVEYLYRVYAIPGLLAAATLAAVGAAVAYRRWGTSLRRWTGFFVIVAFATIPALTAATAAPRVEAFADPYVDVAMRSYLSSLPPDAVLVMNDYGLTGDTELFVLAYLQVVEKLRQDVTVVTDTAIRAFTTADLPGGYARFPLDMRRRLLLRAVLADQDLAGRPIVTSWPATGMEDAWRSYATGHAFLLGTSSENTTVPPLPPLGAAGQPTMRAFVSHMLYAQAASVLEREGVKASMPLLLKAIELDPDPASSDYQDFVRHRAMLIEEGTLSDGLPAAAP